LNLIIIPVLAFLGYFILLIFMLKDEDNWVNKIFRVYIVVMLIWCFGAFMMRTGLPPGALFWNRILCLGYITSPFVFYHFSLVYSNNHLNFRKIWPFYLIAAVLLVANLLGYIVEDVTYNNHQLYYKLGFLSPVLAIFGVGCAIKASFNIYQKDKQTNNRLVFIGALIYTITGFSDFFPVVGSYPIDLLGTLIFAILLSYSILKYKFLDHIIYIRTVLINGLLIGIFGLLYVLFIIILKSFQLNSQVILATGLLILTFFFLQPLKKFIIFFVDTIIYKNKFLKRNTLNNFNQLINTTLDLQILTKSIIDTISDGIDVDNLILFLFDEKENFVHHYHKGYPTQEISSVHFNRESTLIKQLSVTEGLTIEEIEKQSLFKSLWENEKQQFCDLEVKLFIPIKLMNNLIGFILLSNKKENAPFYQFEKDLLLTIASSMALAIQNAKLYLIAKQEANTDGLTKIYNHRFFHDSLSIEFQLAQENNRLLSLIIVDADFFKFYNDLYGHMAGDLALRDIVESIKNVLPLKAIFSRYGGEEFAITLPNSTTEEAYQFAEDIRIAVQDKFGITNKLLTVSLGIATYPINAHSKEELIKNADKALYQAKIKGRNKTVVFSQENVKNNNLKQSIESTYISTVYALTAAIDAKDKYTYGHSQNVAKLGTKLGRVLGLKQENLDVLHYAGLLHDIGKIGIPEHILTKSSRLTPEEFEIMKRHVDIAVSILKHDPGLLEIVPAIISHHERYDGKGYPRGLKGYNIPLEGRILGIVDAFDAMITDRPYREGLKYDSIIEELKKGSGTQFDPELLVSFYIVLEEEYKKRSE